MRKIKTPSTELLLSLIAMLLSFVVFSLVSYLVPIVYIQASPAEDFYRISSPVLFDVGDRDLSIVVTLDACQDVELLFSRVSSFSGSADVTSEVIHIISSKEDNFSVEVAQYPVSTLSVTRGNSLIRQVLTIPCSLESGEYYIRGVVTFKLNGVEKVHEWNTENFYVMSNV